MPKPQSDRRIRFYGPILDALRELGGSAKPKEVEEIVFPICEITEDDLAKLNKDGGSNVRNEFHWARDSLRRFGLLDGSERGVWRLTEEGAKTTLTLDQARALHSNAKQTMPSQSVGPVEPSTEPDEAAEEPPAPPTLLETIRSLPAAGFERLCQRILRESGFVEVKVTGQTGDGGIDGTASSR